MTNDDARRARGAARVAAPKFTQREEIIDDKRVLLPALPPDLVPWRTPDDPVCVHDESGARLGGRAPGRPATALENASAGR